MAESTQVLDGVEQRRSARCRRTGLFIAKGSCFALHGDDGEDIWLDINPVPLHMIDQTVEVSGTLFGRRHIWVEAIGPVGFSPRRES